MPRINKSLKARILRVVTIEPTPLDLADGRRFDDDPAVVDSGVGFAPVVDLGAYER